jgi:CHAT domain-containing protein
MLTRIGEIAADKAGDYYVHDLVGFYRTVHPSQSSLLTTARSLLRDGYDKNKTSKQDALILYRKAKDNFIRAGSDCEIEVVDSLIETTLSWTTEHQRLLGSVEESIDKSRKNRHLWLLGQFLWLRSNLEMNSRDYDQALISGEQALEISKRLGDLNGETGALLNIVASYYFTGDSSRSIPWLRRSLDLSSQDQLIDRRRWQAYSTASNIFNNLGLFFSAAAYEREAMGLDEITSQPLLQSRSHAYMGEIYGSLNDYEEAIRQVKLALAIGKAIDDKVGKNIEAHALLRLGHLYRRSGELSEALGCYDESIELLEQIQLRGDSGDAHRGKMLIHLALGDDLSSQTDLLMAEKIFEKNFSHLTVESLRNSFFDEGQDIYDLAIRFSAERLHDQEQAFNYSEKGRARSLLILMGEEVADDNQHSLDEARKSSGTAPLPLSEIRRQIPASIQIIQYAVLGETIYIWLLSDSEFYGVTTAIGLGDLTDKVKAYLDYTFNPAKANPREAEKVSNELYEILIKPVEQRLDAKRQICIVPDKVLNYLPFGSLVKQGSSTYLIEKYTITISPSSTVFLVCTSAAEKKNLFVEELCLSVGRQRFARQSDLPSAEWEASRVAGYYERPRLLLAANATKESMQREMPNAEVIHIASHGLVNEMMPEYSGIVLSGRSPDADILADDLLQAGEVSRMKLPRAKLIVLSACQTGLGRNYRGEGMVGLARAFLAAGAPQVVASLQSVDSTATGKLMDKFHLYRKRDGLSAANALRRAQLEMMREPDKSFQKPAAWAAFVTVGGYVRY